MKLDKEKMLLIVTGGVLIFLTLIYFILFNPLINEWKAVKGSYINTINKVAVARRIIASLEQGAKRIFVCEEDVSVAIDELTKQGKRKNLNFVSMTPGQIIAERNREYKILPIELEIESDYQALGEFLGILDDLESSLITVKNFNIISKGDKSAQIRAKLTLYMYICEASNAE